MHRHDLVNASNVFAGASDPLEKVHIRKLAHFFNIMRLHYLLVIEEHPGRCLLALQGLSNEGNVVTDQTCQ